jgi:hypothetical protein
LVLGVAFPSTFRLQGFSPSCRFPPPCAARVCFTPVALVGSHPSGVSPPKESRYLYGMRIALLAFAPKPTLTSMVTSTVGAPDLRT